MTTSLRFSPEGTAECLYTEMVDLRALGRLEVVRATGITFDSEDQRWEVRSALYGGLYGGLLFAHRSREACLQWERENLVPGRIHEP